MKDNEQKAGAKKFAEYWKDKGYEKGESQPFWLELLQNVYGIENPAHYITFEEKVHLDHTSFIDGHIPTTHVLIEQKSKDKSLKSEIKQSDGSTLSPFQQAKRYASELPYSKRPRWIITCNFEEFLIYDMEKPNGEPEQIFLKDLSKEYYRLNFLVDTTNENIKKEMELSLKAGEIVGVLYNEILKEYDNPSDSETLKNLNMLCVRLVFCLYAEDAGIFGTHEMFGKYLKSFQVKDVRKALIELFKVLDTRPEFRDKYMDDALAAFPYVNGGLFANEEIEIPRFNEKIVSLLIENASEGFDWSDISPTIFGAVFESTLNPNTRRSGGMHYTSIENIHKVIDPLFMDELKSEFDEIKFIKVKKTRNKRLEEFHKKLSNLKFLDPACGSGNFLTETYISLRRLENELLQLWIESSHGMIRGQMAFGDSKVVSPIKVSISQFYGIEINDFAVTVAKTALWIAESQMMKETEEIVQMNLDFLPLKSYANIIEGNALRIDWESVVPKSELSYIMGNPPFIGARLMLSSQKFDMDYVFGKIKGLGNIDYVSCWYKKSANLMSGTEIKSALVSTNSISQGEQPAILWKELFKKQVTINFAHRTFRWDSEASLKAHVHCVIIGFTTKQVKGTKYLFSDDRPIIVDNINPYLVAAPNILITSRNKPICNVPEIVFGSMPNDSGHLSDFSDEIKNEIVKNYPLSEIMFKKFLGATEFLHNKVRWCLWLDEISPAIIKKVPPVLNAILEVKKNRESSNREATRKLAETPYLFGEIRQPKTQYLIIPCHSSENRRYIPIGFEHSETICGNANLMLPNATLYHFGVLMSNTHNAWMRAVCGRLKSDYRYSKDIVYNNFPWCNPTENQKIIIEKTSQAILDAREKYSDCSLADLYNDLTMPSELRKAHQLNDIAVMNAYGFKRGITESECVAELMRMYQKLTHQ